MTLSTAALAVDDGTYVFKFRTPSNRTHRFQARHDDVENLREIVAGKLESDPFFSVARAASAAADAASLTPDAETLDAHDFQILYTDTDGDTVLITTDSDVTDEVSLRIPHRHVAHPHRHRPRSLDVHLAELRRIAAMATTA